MEYTDEKINEIANDFFKNNRFEKAKIAGFKAGFKKALSLFAVSGSLPLTKDDVTECIMDAYQRGYEDRDLDIGYGSNRDACIKRMEDKIKYRMRQ